MPIIYGNANYRRKYDAFRVIDQSGIEPLTQAIARAQELDSAGLSVQKALEGDLDPETRAQLTLALVKAIPEAFHAWIKVAEFVYAKPKFADHAGNPEESRLNAEQQYQLIKRLEADANAHRNGPP